MLAYLTSRLDCRLMFATHYHALTQEFGANPRVRLAHMGALVHPADSQQAITFLYQLMGGACPRSYGLEVRQAPSFACVWKPGHAAAASSFCQACTLASCMVGLLQQDR